MCMTGFVESPLTHGPYMGLRFDPIVKSDDITNNWTESFNSWIGEARTMAVVEMLKDIRKRWMYQIFERYEIAEAHEAELMPNVQSIIDRRRREARSIRVFQSGQYEYQTSGADLVENVIKMDAKTCTCRVWDICGIPYAHALAVLTYKKGRVEELCDKAFHKATNVRVYSHFVHALPGQKYWAYVDHHSVRSPISRRREEDEVGRSYRVPLKHKTVRCSICNGYGHNMRNCRAAPPSTSNTTAEKEVKK
ncbi:PREDICTED: uncharacterized protein LOC104599412 isoform X2 [Nelumbo nucifera]|uniref:Uncharacterized protein LOC104599412 isoform X2 n=1 Tax=Nelumbo nucifera TaxID=4432 RepID=A0A1U8A044_NELNU|nr:PREDICTED: uncharacterized protein LOC104599412 isoform X2 [Nelumbo nucifera]